MKHTELIQTPEYWTAKIQIDLFNEIEMYMQENDLNRSQLAEHLGVTRGYVTQLLNGDYNQRIASMVKLALSIGRAPVISFKPIAHLINPQARIEATQEDIFKLANSIGQVAMVYPSTINRPVTYPKQLNPCLGAATA